MLGESPKGDTETQSEQMAPVDSLLVATPPICKKAGPAKCSQVRQSKTRPAHVAHWCGDSPHYVMTPSSQERLCGWERPAGRVLLERRCACSPRQLRGPREPAGGRWLTPAPSVVRSVSG